MVGEDTGVASFGKLIIGSKAFFPIVYLDVWATHAALQHTDTVRSFTGS